MRRKFTKHQSFGHLNGNSMQNFKLQDFSTRSIMLRSQLKKKFNNNKSEKNSKKYKQQRNYCLKLLRKTKMEYFQNMDVNKISDNKML